MLSLLKIGIHCRIGLQKLLLYGNLYSPPCRIVSLTLECLNLKYKLMEIWPLKGEHKTPEFLEVSHKIMSIDGATRKDPCR